MKEPIRKIPKQVLYFINKNNTDDRHVFFKKNKINIKNIYRICDFFQKPNCYSFSFRKLHFYFTFEQIKSLSKNYVTNSILKQTIKMPRKYTRKKINTLEDATNLVHEIYLHLNYGIIDTTYTIEAMMITTEQFCEIIKRSRRLGKKGNGLI